MSGERRPLEAIGEQISVTTAEVDSIGGAKPEPEERPASIVTTLDGSTGALGEVPTDHQILKGNPTVRHELSVNELSSLLGKTCRNCAHFNHALGQRTIEAEMSCGTPEQMDHWANVVAEIAISPHINAGTGEEFVSNPFAESPAEREILKMGLCVAMSNGGDTTITHPDGFCPSVEAVGEDLFEPRNADVARGIEQMRDRLFGVASSPK